MTTSDLGTTPRTGETVTLAPRLAEFALRADPPEEALAMMRLSLFDWAACAMAGASEPVARAVRAQVEAEGGTAQASLIGSPVMRAPARAAALLGGAASHALDYDDTHFGPIGHPSVAVAPAALAVAEREGADGRAFLRAALIGAEASVRVGLWLGRGHYAAGFHPTATAGALGAAVAAGALTGLAAGPLAEAIALSAARAAGGQAVFGGMGKPLNAGAAAAGGVEAVDLVAAGLRCDPAGPERHGGLGRLMAGEGRREALRALGGRWEMTGVTHKFHACCHGLHAALEALSQVDIASAALDRVTIRTHPRWLSVCDKRTPRTGLEAKFSYRFTAAMALAGRDTAAIDSYSDAACAEPELVALRDRVDVVGDPSLAETAAVVDVTAHGGRAHRVAHDLAAPMAQERRAAKLRAKATSLLGEEAAAALDDAVLSPQAPDLGELLARRRHAPA